MSANPHVSTLHHVIEEEHFVYFVMDYHPGGDLFSAIIDRKSFVDNDAAVKSVFVQLIDAVQACHDAGIAHRDLKPENIMCNEDSSRAYLTDFGLATETGLTNSYGCGSSLYMSPGKPRLFPLQRRYTHSPSAECVGSMEHTIPYSTRRSDIWALGIILVNMLTGRNPWQLASAARDSGFAQYERGRAAFLLAILPLSREAAELVARVLDPRPRTRIGLPELRAAILQVGTFFPTEGDAEVAELVAAFRASLEDPTVQGQGAEEVDPLDDGELIMEVPIDMEIPAPTSMSGFTSVPLRSPPARMSQFVNQCSTSSLGTDETAPPATPVSPATELPVFVPTLALGADTDAMERGDVHAEKGAEARGHRGVRRFFGAMRRVAIWS